MPNGKGSLDCCYCKWFGGEHGYPGQHGEEVPCTYHHTILPASRYNRICCHFEPNQAYWAHNSEFCPPARRFSWFSTDLEPGVLYEFMYNTPEEIENTVVLRVPDYVNWVWNRPDADDEVEKK